MFFPLTHCIGQTMFLWCKEGRIKEITQHINHSTYIWRVEFLGGNRDLCQSVEHTAVHCTGCLKYHISPTWAFTSQHIAMHCIGALWQGASNISHTTVHCTCSRLLHRVSQTSHSWAFSSYFTNHTAVHYTGCVANFASQWEIIICLLSIANWLLCCWQVMMRITCNVKAVSFEAKEVRAVHCRCERWSDLN